MKNTGEMFWLNTRWVKTGRRIMALILLPIFIIQMSSVNLLAMEYLRVQADEAAVEQPADATGEPQEEPKEEPTSEEEISEPEAVIEAVPVEELSVAELIEETAVADETAGSTEEAAPETTEDPDAGETSTPEDQSMDEAVASDPVVADEGVDEADADSDDEDVAADESSDEAVESTPSVGDEIEPRIDADTDEEAMIEEPVSEAPIVDPVATDTPAIADPASGADLLIEAANNLLGGFGISEEVAPAPQETWAVDDNEAVTNVPVELGKTYVAPQNDQVTVTFTRLPENPGTLSIEEITLTAEQIEMLGALSDKAYDITSDMEDGTFEYDLTLPKPEDESLVEVKYAENISELEQARTVSDDDVRSESDFVSVTLDHFTIFIAASPTDTTGWTNPQNIKVSDNVYATGPSAGLTAKGYGFNIPANATIDGIEVNVERYYRRGGISGTTGTGRIYDSMACLVLNGTPNYAANRAVIWTEWSLVTEQNKVFGGPTDTWGLNLTPADVNNGGFGFLLQPLAQGTTKTAYVDYIGIKVYYTLADTEAPVISPHADVEDEATSPAGAVVNYTVPTATDNVDPTVTVNCSPAPGSVFQLGDTLVTCNASDLAGNPAVPVTFNLEVEDTTAPIIDNVADILVEATSAAGTSVIITPPMSHDAVDGDLPANCDYATGIFPLGVTTVTCTKADAALNVATPETFTITVQDTVAPGISGIPVDISEEQTGPLGNVVNFIDPTALDDVDGPLAVTCVPSSGFVFPQGTTLVACSATDTAGNTASETFSVTIQDTTAPTIDNVLDITVEAAGAAGTAVTFVVPMSHDAIDGDIAASCDAVSGATFSLGTTTVTCTRTDSSGNVATPEIFTVTVEDTTAPTIDNVADISTQATSIAGAWVVIAPPMSHDAVDGDLPAICDYVTGTFPMGVTTVTCSKTDAAGNVATPETFSVTVYDVLTAHKFEDLDADGVQEAGEPNIGGWDMSLYAGSDCAGVQIGSSVATDAGGDALLSDLLPGDYSVSEAANADWDSTPSVGGLCRNFTIGGAAIDQTIDFGNFHKTTIGGQKVSDVNGNGVEDPGEIGLSGWRITLYRWNGASYAYQAETLTDAGGNYLFSGISYGKYQLVEEDRADWTHINPASGNYADIVPVSGTPISKDFFNQEKGKITIFKHTSQSTDHRALFKTDYISDFRLGNGDSKLTQFLLPGSYMVREFNNDDNWDFDRIDCSDIKSTSTFTKSGTLLTINLAAGADVRCTYVNKYDRDSADGDGGGSGSSSESASIDFGSFLNFNPSGTGGSGGSGQGGGQVTGGGGSDERSGPEEENGSDDEGVTEGEDNGFLAGFLGGQSWGWLFLLVVLFGGGWWWIYGRRKSDDE